MSNSSNHAPAVILELTTEEAKFMLGLYELNMHMGLSAMGKVKNPETLRGLVAELDQYKSVHKKLKEQGVESE